ncbi:Daunorubicin/doxorubicin resistance ATP-binding protein DrrA [Streptomyces sp. ADI96-02]|uniref:ATP-binding cassette domain-containing protein n=1 Tax=Streptomyces sp. ADI96-02 TaxID=1522760 RepID=UPI000F54EFCD|nr:ATP-binding cassette domain-containing protein [Streptomyces sp. ADI96-02]RPK61485.1 Daunorubicin/doxorubicin resistance ATP-binding protein DrrA [Streptomyces sp. ADI96-02]
MTDPTADTGRGTGRDIGRDIEQGVERGAEPPYAIEARGLGKSYGDPAVRVLDSVDLRVERGTVFALLGPNGAGKTTCVRVLATLTTADAGVARVAGYDVVAERAAVRRAISLTGQFAAVDETQTGEENLRMTARLTGLSRAAARRRAEELLVRFDLTDAARRLVRTYSGGMRRRLDLAAGLVGSPEPGVFFLDEPTTGLDPRSRRQLWQVVRELAGRGATVLLTTQYLEEADRLADRIALLHQGRIAAEGTAGALKSRVAGHRLDLVLTSRQGYLRLAGRAVHHSPETLTLGLPTDGSAAHVRALLDEIDPDGTEIDRFSLHSATLDDVFLALTSEVPAHV